MCYTSNTCTARDLGIFWRQQYKGKGGRHRLIDIVSLFTSVASCVSRVYTAFFSILLYTMATEDKDKVNLDSIIQRLLEGKSIITQSMLCTCTCVTLTV